jgi:hypothetical protein
MFVHLWLHKKLYFMCTKCTILYVGGILAIQNIKQKYRKQHRFKRKNNEAINCG